nr:hypothetical protein GCM10017745_39810 [Saccharothrix mutabilis subsp. capreolus]
MGGSRKARALAVTAVRMAVGRSGGVVRVMVKERLRAVIGPVRRGLFQALEGGRHLAALLGGVDQVGVGVVVAVHRDEVAAEVHLGGEVVEVVAVQLEADRVSGGEGVGDVPPGLAG